METLRMATQDDQPMQDEQDDVQGFAVPVVFAVMAGLGLGSCIGIAIYDTGLSRSYDTSKSFMENFAG